MSTQMFDPNLVLLYHSSPSHGSDSPQLLHATYMLEADVTLISPTSIQTPIPSTLIGVNIVTLHCQNPEDSSNMNIM
jgi:hypothetical protein